MILKIRHCVAAKITVILFLLMPHLTSAQNYDSIPLQSEIPIRKGFILKASPNANSICESDGVYIFNHFESDSVFSITVGTVESVVKFDVDFFCLIKVGSKLVSYGPFKSCPVEIGDYVKRGDYLGAMNDDNYEDGKYYLLILAMKGEKYLSRKKYVSWINRKRLL